MVLVDLKEDNKWINSRWIVTYRIGWEQMLKICAFASNDYDMLEILVDKKQVSERGEDIFKLAEAGSLTFRGLSSIIGTPIMITLYNQTDVADVSVAMATEEFSKADYESFNKSLAQYLTSIEMAMLR